MGDPIELTNREVLESVDSLAKLSQVKLPAKASYAVAKALGKLAELEKTIRGVQKSLWEKYGEKDETGKLKIDPANNTFSIPAANSALFVKEHNELLAEVNEISGLRTVNISELSDATVEPAVLVHLDWLLKDE